ncbi:PAS domain-containing protein [Pusillimonas minor]|uniref:PAS domain-containing protein n=1 Tax=Pusillimonas minor TaxID=2697024 RepID=A0A842HPB3_9BURK|nr:PAS domain-containing protein [Pusillimonas minor]MBC2769448.1 PAS domain-containing protein [Pusillimonas minor]
MQGLDNVLDVNTPVAVVVVDANGVVQHINRWMTDWSGHAPDAVAGTPFELLYPEVLAQGWPFGSATRRAQVVLHWPGFVLVQGARLTRRQP